MNWLKAFIILCAVILGSWLPCVAQTNEWFDRISFYEKSLPANEWVDSVTALPNHIMLSNLAKSSHWLTKGLKVAFEIRSEENIADISARLGVAYYLQGKYDSSTYYNMEAIRLYEKMGLNLRKAVVLCEQGYQTKRRNLDQAFVLFRQGLQILEEAKAQTQLLAAYDNFGVLFEMKNDLDSAEYFYLKSLHGKELAKDSLGIPFSLNKIAQLYLTKKDFLKAEAYFSKAYAIREQRDDAFGIMENKTFFGDLYSQWQKMNQAIQWYLESNRDAQRLDYPMLLQYNYQQLALCYEKNGDFAAALDAERNSTRVKDLLLNKENSKTILELEEQFKSVEKDRNISELKRQAAEKKQTQYLIIIIATLLIFSILIFFINAKRKDQKARDTAIIKEREAGIQAVFDATEEERKRIAKDLHDGIGQQLSGLRMSWESLSERMAKEESQQSEKLQLLTTILDETCREVRTISHTMMPRALQEKGLLVAIEEMATKSLGITPIRFQIEHYKMEGARFADRVELSLYRICQELINNIIKHSKASEVNIQLLLNKKNLVLIVEDNGIGFNHQNDNQGMGRLNIVSRLNTIHGEIDYSPGPEQGTVVSIRVPVE